MTMIPKFLEVDGTILCGREGIDLTELEPGLFGH
jgi:hypothetical protein